MPPRSEDSVRISVAAGETLFREGDPPGPAYLIERGTLEVSALRDGEQMVLGTLGPGDLLGEMALIDQAPRTAAVVALEDCTLMNRKSTSLNSSHVKKS